MIWDPSTLAYLSAPGFNRAIGAYDVIPYWGAQPNQTAGGAGTATPGVTYDPNALALTASPASGANGVLNNLSALTPIFNQIIRAQQQAAIPSGQSNAQAQGFGNAVPGRSSASMAQAIGGVPIAGTSTPSGDLSSDVGAAPSVGEASGVSAGAPAGTGTSTGVGGDAPGTGAGEGSAPAGEASGQPGGVGGAPGGEGESTGGEGTGGAGGGGGDGAGTVLASYTLRTLKPRNARRAIAFWTRVREMFLAASPEGAQHYATYQRIGTWLVARIEALPAAEKAATLQRLNRDLIAPHTHRATAADVEPAVNTLIRVVSHLVVSFSEPSIVADVLAAHTAQAA